MIGSAINKYIKIFQILTLPKYTLKNLLMIYMFELSGGMWREIACIRHSPVQNAISILTEKSRFNLKSFFKTFKIMPY